MSTRILPKLAGLMIALLLVAATETVSASTLDGGAASGPCSERLVGQCLGEDCSGIVDSWLCVVDFVLWCVDVAVFDSDTCT